MKIVAVTSCPTGIAHTYMAAEALEQAAKDAGHEIKVETQGAAGAEAVPDADIAAAAPGAPRWLQIYVFRDREVSDQVIEQALESGFTALVLTADLPVYGIRHREARLGFEAPEDNVPAIVAARERGGARRRSARAICSPSSD